MKKITLILLALISGTAFAQNTASDGAEVFAEIVAPITIESTQELQFGKIAVATSSGTVRVSETGVITYSDPAMKLPSTDILVNPAKFDISAPEGTLFTVAIPNSSLTGPGTAMPISFTHNLDAAGNVGSTSITKLNVGGLLQVNGDQEPGKYEGTVTVTVSYQ